MATEIRVPTLGESVTEATIGKWFKKVGDAIAIDEPLVELETDKVTVEVPAAAAGVLAEITAKEGDTVEVNALLGQISTDGAAVAAAPAAKKEEAKPAAAPAAAPVASASSGPAMQPAPAASKLLAENNLSADQVDGSGKRGQVLKGDVLDAIAKGVSAAPAPAAPAAARPASSAGDVSREERVKMTRLRQTIAKRLKDAQNTAAMLTTYNEVDMSAVMELRTKYKDVFEKKHGVKLGFMGFFTKAVTHALKEIPAVNAEIDGTDIIYKNFAHVGMAVGTDKGLVVPVIRDADQLSIAGVEKELGR
ncbi:MAG: 2-oxo acid dehydrogenase subunit E2, partial [Brucella anthropi]